MVSLSVTAPAIACSLNLVRSERNDIHLSPIQQKVELSAPGAPFSRFDHDRGLKR